MLESFRVIRTSCHPPSCLSCILFDWYFCTFSNQWLIQQIVFLFCVWRIHIFFLYITISAIVFVFFFYIYVITCKFDVLCFRPNKYIYYCITLMKPNVILRFFLRFKIQFLIRFHHTFCQTDHMFRGSCNSFIDFYSVLNFRLPIIRQSITRNMFHIHAA